MQKYKRSRKEIKGLVIFLSLFVVLSIVFFTSGVKIDSEKEDSTKSTEVISSFVEPPTETQSEDTTYYDEVTDPNFQGYSESTTDPPEQEEVHISYYNYTAEELDLLARLIYSEGGIESYDTMLKIGSVVMNRVSDTIYFPNTIEEVIYQKNQFSVTFQKVGGVIMIDRPASNEAKAAALEVLEYGSVLPSDVEVFYGKSITTGWVSTRVKYGTFDHTIFAYVYSE